MMTEDDDQQTAVWVVLIGVVLLAVGLTVGVGLQRSLKSEGSNAAAVPVRTVATTTDSASQEPSAQVASTTAAADSASQDANSEAASTTAQAADNATAAPSSDSAVASGEAQNADAGTESTTAQASDSDNNATSAEAQTADATNADSDAPSLRVDEDKVTFYFASGKADLAEGAPEALANIIKGVAIGQTAVISGYHDPTGDLARNQELARAEAVAEALRALGVSEDKLELRKPEQTEAQGQSLAEARRVEVRLQ